MNFFLIWFSKAFQNRIIPFLMVINDDISGLLATPAVQLNVVVVMCLIFIPPPTSYPLCYLDTATGWRLSKRCTGFVT